MSDVLIVRALNRNRPRPTLYVRIPRSVAEQLGLKEGSVLKYEIKGNKLILRKIA